MTTRIHPTAVLDGDVRLAADVVVGPHCVITGPVEIGPGSVLDAQVRVSGPTRLGARNRLFPFCSIGSIPQDLKYVGELSELVVGDDNTFREGVTVNRGTRGGGMVTRIGDGGLFMAYAHVAHDSQVGDRVILANGATLAGHVTVADYSVVGAFSALHQFCRTGPYAFIGGYSVITRDALPFVKTIGEGRRGGIYGINVTGLKRLGFTPERIATLKRAYRLLFRGSRNLALGLAALRQEMPVEGDVRVLVEFIESSERGIHR